MVDPIRGGMEAGLKLGVGKAEQESFYISADNVTRKRMEAEIQLEEDSARTARRLVRFLVILKIPLVAALLQIS